jgi:predicted GNAT family acetyltransferase
MTSVVRDCPERRRYELEVDGDLAFIDYRRDGQVVIMTHAEVPPALRGGGVGSALVRGALALVREQGDTVVPLCSFVEHYMRRHPEARDLLARSDRFE